MTADLPAWSGVQVLSAEITSHAGSEALPAGAVVSALSYPQVCGTVRVGDRVLLTVDALIRGLGTGGHALVVAVPDRLPPDPPPSPGHIVKARYTPLQQLVLGVDEQESPHHEILREADDLEGMPVVVADLHSALPAIIAGARAEARQHGRRAPRVVYVMTDGGALPAAFSATCAALREAGWLVGTITSGQAFGGDLESVTVHSGLLAARHVMDADLAVVAQGPGNLGTGTRWGFSGVATGESLNAAAVLGGRPVAALRVSAADPRPRHRGISHHTATSIGRVALAPADIAVPVLAGDFGELVRRQAAALAPRHRIVNVATDDLLADLDAAPVRFRTMGRTLADDPTPFLAAAAAGRWAARLQEPVRGAVWHLARAADWAAAQATGSYEISTRDLPLTKVGFVHASFAPQVEAIAAAIYDGVEDLVLLEIDADALARRGVPVVAEPGDPRDPASERYPHVYGAVPADVVTAQPWRGSFGGSTSGATASEDATRRDDHR